MRKKKDKKNYKNRVTLYTLQFLHSITELHDPSFRWQVYQDTEDEIEPVKVSLHYKIKYCLN